MTESPSMSSMSLFETLNGFTYQKTNSTTIKNKLKQVEQKMIEA